MTEEKFTELVNLYLDKEITERSLAGLKAELAANADRKAEFAERCRLHQAMRLALNPQSSKRRSKSRRSGEARSSRSSRSQQRPSSRSSRQPVAISTRETRVDPSAERVTHFPRWMMGTGLAASFALGFALLTPVFRDTTHAASQPALEGVEADELVEVDPLDTIGRNELRRFATIQEQRAANQRASIAAQLRLMGLSPELTPEEKQLRPISVAAAQRPKPTRNHAELLAEVQKMTAMPAQQILRVESLQPDPAVRWPGGFKSSLASFK